MSKLTVMFAKVQPNFLRQMLRSSMLQRTKWRMEPSLKPAEKMSLLRRVMTYSAHCLRSGFLGGVAHLSWQDRFESVMFSLYVNGFAFSTLDGREVGL